MKKILHIIGGMDRAGAETFLKNILTNISDKKYSFGILTFLEPQNGKKYDYQEELEKKGVIFYHIKDTRFSHPLRFRNEIARIVRENNYKIVHSHNDFMSAFLLDGAKRGGATTLISHAHSTSNARVNSAPKRLLSNILKKKLRRLSDIKLACGQSAGECLYGKGADFTVIPNGIDLKRFAFDTEKRKLLRKKYKLSEKTAILLNIGRLEPVKNQAFLIDIFEKVAEKQSDVALFIVGNGSLKNELKERANHSSVSNKIFLVAAQQDTSPYYSMADFFLLSSLFEGLPMVSVEAQASGLPCFFSENISKDADITKEATFTPINSAENWAEAIISAKINTEARKGAWKKNELSSFDIRRSAKELEKIYDAIENC